MKKLVFTFVLAIASSWVYAADAPAVKEASTKAAPAATDAKTGVRKPTGDVDKFWDGLDWDKMSADEQKLMTVLGWTAKSWHGDKSQAPASENADWDKLSKAEQEAATALSYDKKSWDAK